MRLIKTIVFDIGTKTPYAKWPDIVHQYLKEQGLTSRTFLYYFMDVCTESDLESRKRFGSNNRFGCDRLYRDLPEIGIPRERHPEGNHPKLYISNIDTLRGCPEDKIMPLMNKIHRRYGLTQSDLYYLDVDFFSGVIPFGRHHAWRDQYFLCEEQLTGRQIPFENQLHGSGFHLHRYATGGNYLSLSIDILRNDTILDPAPYFEALKVLLPGIRSHEHLDIYATDEEKSEFSRLTAAAQTVIGQSRDWLSRRLPGEGPQNRFSSNYNIAPLLKKQAKQRGYLYKNVWSGLFFLTRKTEHGHYLCLTCDSGPSRYDVTFYIELQGLGFNCHLHLSDFTPKNQQEFDECAILVFDVLDDFSRESLPVLDACWPPSPAWFEPSP